jgi:serine phosphatase RsbU (regulator of sigma subunit)
VASKPPRLIVIDSTGLRREVEVARTPFTLGRQADNDVVLLDSRVSRRHACILRTDSGYVMEDVGSRHGTFVNGQRITTCPLPDGAQIVLGVADAYQISFVLEQEVVPGLLEKLHHVTASPAPQLQHLSLLLLFAQRMCQSAALEEVLSTLVDSALEIAGAERGMLFLREANGELGLRLARGCGETLKPQELDDYSRAVVERVAKTGREEVILEEAASGSSPQQTGFLSGQGRGIVALPLQKLPMPESSGETIYLTAPELLGVLYLDTWSRPTSLTSLDREVLRTFAVEGATIVENARLFRLQREQERSQNELALARNIQMGLLPRALPSTEHFALAALTMPCRTVGGDYYDVIDLPGDRVGLVVADVSGKGLPAAILAATMQGAFGAVAAGDPALPELFQRVNDFLCARTTPGMFVTLFYGVLDPEGQFIFLNAGHTAPMVVSARSGVYRLEVSHVPLGLFPNIGYQVASIQLEPGDQIVIYSDGVNEAADARGEFFGEGRLRDLLEGTAGQPAAAVVQKVVAAVKNFVGEAPQTDDLTLLVLSFGASLEA